MKVHYLQHVSFEGLGYIETWLTNAGHEISHTHFFEADYRLPPIAEFDALIVMGGPMGVYDENHYPWLHNEKMFIKQCIEQQKKVLGICLGAQLIVAALGGDVHKAPQTEIGWFPVTLTEGGNRLTWIRDLFKDNPIVFHWHGDQFEIPVGGMRNLLFSAANTNQAFLCGDDVIGLQFHLEVTTLSVEEMLHYGATELQPAPYVQSYAQIREGIHRNVTICNCMMSTLLGKWLQ